MSVEKYFERNRRWLVPMLCGLIIAGSSTMLLVIDPELGDRLSWLSVLGFVLAGLSAGFGVAVTDTLSARLLASVAFLGTLAAFAHSLLGLASVSGGAVLAAAALFVVLMTFKGRRA